MRKTYFLLLAAFISNTFYSCNNETDFFPDLDTCQNLTPHFGNIQLGTKQLCWDNIYPIQVVSTGTGNCGEGYKYVAQPYLATGIGIQEYDVEAPEYSVVKSYLELMIPFACEDFSTQEKFYNLFAVGQTSFGTSWTDYGKVIISYIKDDQVYTLFENNDQQSSIEILSVEKVKPDFLSETSNKTASIDISFRFSVKLKNESGELINIPNAVVSGRLYRQAPYNQYWDDWGAGFDE